MGDITLFFRRRKSHTKNTTINIAPTERLHAIPAISPALRPLCLDPEFEEEFEEEVGFVDALSETELGNGTAVVVVAALLSFVRVVEVFTASVVIWDGLAPVVTVAADENTLNTPTSV